MSIVPDPPQRHRASRAIIILALDLSLTSTGYALLVPGSGIPPVTGRLISKKTGIARLQDLRHQLWTLVKCYTPTHWAVEGYSYNSQAKQHAIGEWGGVAKLVLEELVPGRGHIVSPACVKKFVTGNHAAKKPEMVLSLFKRYGWDISQEDEADAAALAAVIAAYLGGSEQGDLTEFQRDALGWVSAKKKTVPVQIAS